MPDKKQLYREAAFAAALNDLQGQLEAAFARRHKGLTVDRSRAAEGKATFYLRYPFNARSQLILQATPDKLALQYSWFRWSHQTIRRNTPSGRNSMVSKITSIVDKAP